MVRSHRIRYLITNIYSCIDIPFFHIMKKKYNLEPRYLNIKPTTCVLYRDLSYGEILSGRPGAWLVKKIFFCMHAIKKVKKGIYIEIQNDFQNMFKFYDSLYGL